MESSLLDHIKKQASSFLQNKYKNARLALTDVTKAELLTEEATNNDPWGPDARTMTKIAQASYDIDDYWRIVDIIHKRFDETDWKEWRQSYKTLVLVEFLLTHGPEEIAKEFQGDCDIIEELGKFQYIDDKGFNWGMSMQKRSYNIRHLLNGGIALKEARLKALRITKGIQGFGNVVTSPTSPSSSSSSSDSSRSDSSSFFSFSPSSSCTEDDFYFQRGSSFNDKSPSKEFRKENHVWSCQSIQEKGSLLEFEDSDDDRIDDEEVEENLDGYLLRAYKKFSSNTFGDNIKRLSDASRLIKKQI